MRSCKSCKYEVSQLLLQLINNSLIQRHSGFCILYSVLIVQLTNIKPNLVIITLSLSKGHNLTNRINTFSFNNRYSTKYTPAGRLLMLSTVLLLADFV
jgi:hypothetical protein